LALHPGVEMTTRDSTRKPMTWHARAPIVWPMWRWLTSSGDGMWTEAESNAPREIALLRIIGLFFVGVVVVDTVTSHPRPALSGSGLAVSLALAAILGGVVVSNPRTVMSVQRRVGGLALVAAGGVALEIVLPKGVWEVTIYFIAVVAAIRLPRRAGVAVLAGASAAFIVVAVARGDWGATWSTLLGAVPWFIVLRLMRELGEQYRALRVSRAAEAAAAAEAERGRIAREMHDVLAHSLSALALQLETTRLLARERGVDDEVAQAIDQAHHLAVGGLDEARAAIGATRRDELPGPERLPALADAFAQQSGVLVDVETQGDPHELAPDARLAVYRTAQEALTNVRRHAVADRVLVRLRYDDEGTTLTVEDRGDSAIPVTVGPPSGPGGYGLTGMRERAELLGGRLLAKPIDGGFRVQLWLPLG